MQRENKPLRKVYEWIGFFVFWPSIISGAYSVIHWLIWSHKVLEASGI